MVTPGHRWLVALALAVVATPAAADARCKTVTQTRTVSTTTTLPSVTAPRISPLPASVEIDPGAVVVRANGRSIRHTLGRRDGVSWMVTAGSRVLVGFAVNRGPADAILAIDHVTGEPLWRRAVDSRSAVELTGDLLALEREGQLDIVDLRDGSTVGSTPITGDGILSVSRAGGDLHLKTQGDLVAIDVRTGRVRWTQSTSSVGNVAVTSNAVVDAWVDRATHRYGIVTYDPATGRRLDSIELGATGGWYDRERVDLACDGPGEVMVSAMFAVA